MTIEKDMKIERKYFDKHITICTTLKKSEIDAIKKKGFNYNELIRIGLSVIDEKGPDEELVKIRKEIILIRKALRT